MPGDSVSETSFIMVNHPANGTDSFDQITADLQHLTDEYRKNMDVNRKSASYSGNDNSANMDTSKCYRSLNTLQTSQKVPASPILAISSCNGDNGLERIMDKDLNVDEEVVDYSGKLDNNNGNGIGNINNNIPVYRKYNGKAHSVNGDGFLYHHHHHPHYHHSNDQDSITTSDAATIDDNPHGHSVNCLIERRLDKYCSDNLNLAGILQCNNRQIRKNLSAAASMRSRLQNVLNDYDRLQRESKAVITQLTIEKRQLEKIVKQQDDEDDHPHHHLQPDHHHHSNGIINNNNDNNNDDAKLQADEHDYHHHHQHDDHHHNRMQDTGKSDVHMVNKSIITGGSAMMDDVDDKDDKCKQMAALELENTSLKDQLMHARGELDKMDQLLQLNQFRCDYFEQKLRQQCAFKDEAMAEIDELNEAVRRLIEERDEAVQQLQEVTAGHHPQQQSSSSSSSSFHNIVQQSPMTDVTNRSIQSNMLADDDKDYKDHEDDKDDNDNGFCKYCGSPNAGDQQQTSADATDPDVENRRGRKSKRRHTTSDTKHSTSMERRSRRHIPVFNPSLILKSFKHYK